MKCEKCEGELERVSNLIEGIDYYYCRKCKTHRRYLLIGKIKSNLDMFYQDALNQRKRCNQKI